MIGLGAAVLGFLGAPSLASAQSLNPSLSRLVIDHRCNASYTGGGSFADYARANDRQRVGRWNTDPEVQQAYSAATRRDGTCSPDHAMFKQLVNEWGFALAPTAMHSARTTGFGGFHFSIEGAYTSINGDADYWKLGSRGPRDPSSNAASHYNASPPSILQTYAARVRKSFGFGLELGTQVGFVPDTTILTGGADVRMALLEGFRTGFLGILPDIAAGAGIRTITGTADFQLSTVGIDAQISKPLAIASQSVLTPWIGYQYLMIFGDSGLIDLTPATDAVGYCQATGPNVPGNPDPNEADYSGQPVCANGGSPYDFNNNVVFNNARLERQRMILGMNYRYEMVSVGGEFIFDVVSPSDAQVDDDTTRVVRNGEVVDETDADVLKDSPRQWTLVLEIGAMF
jgi:hypothetical protein